MKNRYQWYGYLLIFLGLVWLGLATGLYYYPPNNMTEITQLFVTWLPQIAGIENLKKLNIWKNQLGDRVAFALAISYVPMIFVGYFSLYREYAFKKAMPKSGKFMSIVVIIYTATTGVAIHYLVYWQSYYGRFLSPMHPFISCTTPFFTGVICCGVYKSIKINWFTNKLGAEK